MLSKQDFFCVLGKITGGVLVRGHFRYTITNSTEFEGKFGYFLIKRIAGNVFGVAKFVPF